MRFGDKKFHVCRSDMVVQFDGSVGRIRPCVAGPSSDDGQVDQGIIDLITLSLASGL